MLARTFSCAVVGLDGVIVEVEVDQSNARPAIIIVGSPDEPEKPPITSTESTNPIFQTSKPSAGSCGWVFLLRGRPCKVVEKSKTIRI